MKINYIIFLVVLLIVGNYLRLKVEENNVPKIEINEEVEYQKEGAEKLNKIESKKDLTLFSKYLELPKHFSENTLSFKADPLFLSMKNRSL